MEVTITEILWAIIIQTLIIVGCFISIDRYAYKRTMLFAHALEDIKTRLTDIEQNLNYVANTVQRIRTKANFNMEEELEYYKNLRERDFDAFYSEDGESDD